MPVPAFPFCRSLPEGPQPRGRSSSTACFWFRFRCSRGHSGLSAQSTPRPPLSAVRSLLCSRCNWAGAVTPIGTPRIACSHSPLCTCSFCLRRCWSATAIDGRPRPPGGLRRLSDRRCWHCCQAISEPRAVLSASGQMRSNMRYAVLAVVPVAAAERLILFNSLGIMLAIVIPTILATLGVALWFRASNWRARYLPDFEYSGRLEMLVWSIPAMTVLLVGGVAWVGSHDLAPRKAIASTAKAVRVQVVSLDWKWLFIYPEQGIASVNQLTIPVGTPVSFELTSSGVMNSFFVPQLGSQIYTMAGMATHLHLQADHEGAYRGLSANYSGSGFADMRFTVDAVPPGAFAQWIDRVRSAGPVLDAGTYAQLAKPSSAVAPFT